MSDEGRASIRPHTPDQITTIQPSAEELAVLSRSELFAFAFVRRMNRGTWKAFWTFFQRTVGAYWIHICTYNLTETHGLENLELVSHDRPLILAANHRSFFDMYVVSSLLFRKTSWRKRLFFPVRGRFFYDTVGGMLVNLVMGWWSMFPPFFTGGDSPIPEKRDFDKFSMRLLTHLARVGAGHVIGFHPEGTRNKGDDPYSFLRPQPGIGKLIKDARPQVIPVFIAGLGNDLLTQVLDNWRDGETIRVHFGPPLALAEFYDKRDHVRTYKEIGEFVMNRISELAEQDRLVVNRTTRKDELENAESSLRSN